MQSFDPMYGVAKLCLYSIVICNFVLQDFAPVACNFVLQNFTPVACNFVLQNFAPVACNFVLQNFAPVACNFLLQTFAPGGAVSCHFCSVSRPFSLQHWQLIEMNWQLVTMKLTYS